MEKQSYLQNNMKTTYIVSGYMRTGTSMMMKALEAGGLEPVYNKNRDKMNERFGDEYYEPNEGGFYELEVRDYREFDFPKKFEGKLIKCLWGGLMKMIVGKYKIAFMMRDPEEIRQSYEGFFNQSPPSSFKNYKEQMKNSIEMMRNRKDVEITVLNYRDVIENPEKEFMKLKDADWEIDVNKSISTVNSNLFRFRKENLTKGI